MGQRLINSNRCGAVEEIEKKDEKGDNTGTNIPLLCRGFQGHGVGEAALDTYPDKVVYHVCRASDFFLSSLFESV